MCAYYMIGKSVNSTVIAGLFCDSVVMWRMVVPVGFIAAFLWHLPVLAVYFILSLDEMLKLPAVYKYFQKYKWVNDLTQKEGVL